jgi:RNA polymerase sigma-70 factor (ECF subfamily)
MTDRVREEAYEALRAKAFRVAYRMLGSVSEAEDVVQEGLLRLHRELEDGAEIDSPEGYLVTIVTRLAIDELRSARARREQYIGEWLPDPILTDEDSDPARQAEIADSLSISLLLLLETLSPDQRAVFLLREVFDYPHERIAEVLGKSPAAVRQLAVRARERVDSGEPRFETSREQRERLVGDFIDAFQASDLEALEGMLAADVTLRGDGGGKAPALPGAIQGRSRVARALHSFSVGARRGGVAGLRQTDVNGEPGFVAVDADGRLVRVIAVEIAAGQIRAVNSVANPDKLRHLGPLADLGAEGGSR